MSLLPTCAVCDALLYVSGKSHCERCNSDCPECGKRIGFCLHPLPDERLTATVERELRSTMQMQRRAAA
jgi:hypothetical protein